MTNREKYLQFLLTEFLKIESRIADAREYIALMEPYFFTNASARANMVRKQRHLEKLERDHDDIIELRAHLMALQEADAQAVQQEEAARQAADRQKAATQQAKTKSQHKQSKNADYLNATPRNAAHKNENPHKTNNPAFYSPTLMQAMMSPKTKTPLFIPALQTIRQSTNRFLA